MPQIASAPIGAPRVKPRLRGVSHQIAAFLAPVAAFLLVRAAPTERAAILGAVYGLSLLALFGVSALYHRLDWGPAARQRMARLDHANIFLFIAGSYAPICLLGVGGTRGALVFSVIAAGALLGIAQTLFWPKAPRALHVAIYVVIGWAGALGLDAEWRRLGARVALLHVLGGLLYTIGAVIYARKRPDPYPRVFGHHEIFHLFVIAACGCLYEVIRRSVLLG